MRCLKHLICLLPHYFIETVSMTLCTPISLTPSEALLPPPALPSRVLCSLLSPYSPWVTSSTFSFQLHPPVASESPEYISSLDHHAQSFIPMAPTVYWTPSPGSYKTYFKLIVSQMKSSSFLPACISTSVGHTTVQRLTLHSLPSITTFH